MLSPQLAVRTVAAPQRRAVVGHALRCKLARAGHKQPEASGCNRYPPSLNLGNTRPGNRLDCAVPHNNSEVRWKLPTGQHRIGRSNM